jgi:hypothetical protein
VLCNRAQRLALVLVACDVAPDERAHRSKRLCCPSRREPHSHQERPEPRIRSQRIEARQAGESDGRQFLVVSPIEHLPRTFSIAEAANNHASGRAVVAGAGLARRAATTASRPGLSLLPSAHPSVPWMNVPRLERAKTGGVELARAPQGPIKATR